MTFSNPHVDYVFEFGSAVAAFSNDRVLISADSYGSGLGQVFLFNTNGTLLTTITNPAPGIQNYFSHSIAAVGADRIVVGAPHLGNTVGNTNRVGYVFNTNGTLLVTITNRRQW
jgi:hypothetical protein